MTMLHATTISAAFVFGMILALLGSLKLALAKRLNLGEGRIGFLLSALNGAIIPLMLLDGYLIDLLGVRIILILGSLTTAVAVGSLGMRPTYGRAFGSLLLAGFGSAGLGAAAIVLMPQAFFGVDRLASASISLGCVFMALGAQVTPVLTDVLVRLLEFRRTAGVLAVLCLAPAVLAAAPDQFPNLAAQGADLSALLTDGDLWLVGLVFLFYAPLEGSISVWATTYLTDLGQGESAAMWTLSAFWGAFLASRLATALLFHAVRAQYLPYMETWLLVLAGGLAAAVIGNLVGTGHRSAAKISLVLLGLLLGPIFPTVIGLVFRIAPTAPGTAYGVVFALGSVGSLVMAPLVGARARRTSVQSALYIPMMLALALAAVALVVALTVTLPA
jgi:Major Facilitator Superfamily